MSRLIMISFAYTLLASQPEVAVAAQELMAKSR